MTTRTTILFALALGACHEAAEDRGNLEPSLGEDSLALACEADLTCPDGGTCDARTLKCVDCSADSDCAAGVCDPRANVCVQCVDDGDCGNGFCHPTRALCVGCWNDGQCGSGVCHPDQLACVECLADENCRTADGAIGVCNAVTSSCVGDCTRDAECADNDPCTTEVCADGACLYTKEEGCGCGEELCVFGSTPLDLDQDLCVDACMCTSGEVVEPGVECGCPEPPLCPIDTKPHDRDQDGCNESCTCENGAFVGADGTCPCPLSIACGGGLVPSDLNGDGCAETCTLPCGESCDCIAQGLAAFAECPADCATCGPVLECVNGVCSGACSDAIFEDPSRACECPPPPQCGAIETAVDTDQDGCNDTCECLVAGGENGFPARDPDGDRKCGCPFAIDCREGAHPVDSDQDGCDDTCACDDAAFAERPDGSCCQELACPAGSIAIDKEGDACPDVCLCPDGSNPQQNAEPACACLEKSDCPQGFEPVDTNQDGCADTCACENGAFPGPNGCESCFDSCGDQELPPHVLFVDLDGDGCYDLVDACPVGTQGMRSDEGGCPDVCVSCNLSLACPERAFPIDSDGDNCADVCICENGGEAPEQGCGCMNEIVCGPATVAIDRDNDGCVEDCAAPCANACDCTRAVASAADQSPCGEDCADCRVVGSCVEGFCAFECVNATPGGVSCIVAPESEPVCGCDDVTYASACEAGRADVQVKRDGACETSGCTNDSDCAPSELCELPTGACLAAEPNEPSFIPVEQRGECQSIPNACIDDGSPVCGCDGQNCENDCERRKAGVARARAGACVAR